MSASCRACQRTGDICRACESHAEDRRDDMWDDDVRERDFNYTREFGAMLTRGGW